jgi:hypothetical protein
MGGQKRPLPPEEFVNQKVGEAIGKIGETVFPLRTPLVPQTPNSRLSEYIIERSARPTAYPCPPTGEIPLRVIHGRRM